MKNAITSSARRRKGMASSPGSALSCTRSISKVLRICVLVDGLYLSGTILSPLCTILARLDPISCFSTSAFQKDLIAAQDMLPVPAAGTLSRHCLNGAGSLTGGTWMRTRSSGRGGSLPCLPYSASSFLASSFSPCTSVARKVASWPRIRLMSPMVHPYFSRVFCCAVLPASTFRIALMASSLSLFRE